MINTELKDELDEDFARTQRVIQRVGWSAMALIMLLAVVGVFGTGPLAWTTVTREVGEARYEVEHTRFSRYQLLERLHVHVHAPRATGEELRIAFSNDWIGANAVGASTPEPHGGGAGAEGAYYSYAIASWTDRISIVFEYAPQKAFRSGGTVTIAAGDLDPVALRIDTWVNP